MVLIHFCFFRLYFSWDFRDHFMLRILHLGTEVIGVANFAWAGRVIAKSWFLQHNELYKGTRLDQKMMINELIEQLEQLRERISQTKVYL